MAACSCGLHSITYIRSLMTASMEKPQKVHEGRNVRRFREMMGLKQEALASELGDDWNQKRISLLEQKETIDEDILELVAKTLKVPVEAIRNFDENTAVNIINSTFTDNDGLSFFPGQVNHSCTFNPIDKLMEIVEENKNLYERLLASEREKVEILRERNR